MHGGKKKPPDKKLVSNRSNKKDPKTHPKKNPRKSTKKEPWVKTQKHIDYEDSLRNMISVKLPLKKIVRRLPTITTIFKDIQRANKVIYLTYQFIDLFWAHMTEINIKKPELNKNFVFNVMRVICIPTRNVDKLCKEETNKLKKILQEFYDNHFKKVMGDIERPSYDKLRQILDYEAETIITCFENHIIANFKMMIGRYINIMCDKDGKVQEIEENEKLSTKEIKASKSKYFRELTALKFDIISHEDKCLPKYNKLKKKIRSLFNTQNYTKDQFLTYHVSIKPLSFLDPLIRISIEGEKKMTSRMNKLKKEDRKMFNIIKCFPLRTQITPKHVKFDTTQIIYSLIKNNVTVYARKPSKYHDYVWNCFFKTDQGFFNKKGYRFNNMISTDGISCTLFFIKKDLYNPSKKTGKSKRKPKDYKEDLYVEDLTEEQKEKIRGKVIAGGDPGADELLHFADGNTGIIEDENGNIKHKPNTFRYTRAQRKKEIKYGKYKAIIEYYRKTTTIKGKTVEEWESELSKYNLNTCIFKNLSKALTKKNEITNILFDFYQKDLRQRW